MRATTSTSAATSLPQQAADGDALVDDEGFSDADV
jgi:hypothetical protein